MRIVLRCSRCGARGRARGHRSLVAVAALVGTLVMVPLSAWGGDGGSQTVTQAYQEVAAVLWSPDATPEQQTAAAKKFLADYPEGDYAEAVRVRCWQLGLTFEGLGEPPSPTAEQMAEATELMTAILDAEEIPPDQKAAAATCYFGTFGDSDQADELERRCQTLGVAVTPQRSTPERALKCLQEIEQYGTIAAPASAASPPPPSEIDYSKPRKWSDTFLAGLQFGAGIVPSASYTGSFVGTPPGQATSTPSSGTLNAAAALYALQATWYHKRSKDGNTDGGITVGLDAAGNAYKNETQDVKDHYLGAAAGAFRVHGRFLMSSAQLGAGAHFRKITIPYVSGYYHVETESCYWTCWFFDSTTVSKQVGQEMVGDPGKDVVPYVSARLDLVFHPIPLARIFVGYYLMTRYDLVANQSSVEVVFEDDQYHETWQEQWDIVSEKFLLNTGFFFGFEI